MTNIKYDNYIFMNETTKNSVLIVDDERINLDLLVKTLNPEYTVYMTKSGSSAIKMANEKLPDIILLDIIMKDISGYQVLEALKASEKTRHIPVIFITGLDSDDDEEKGLSLHAADYIFKPLRPSIVKLRVGNQIQIVNQIREIKKYSYEVAAAEERSKFFAKMSHEMRTPLNAVIGFSEMTLENCSLSDEAADNIEKVCSAGNSLLYMVNDILDISKIEEDKFNLVPVEYDFPGMINDTVTQNNVLKNEKPIKFILSIEEDIPLRLFGDDQRIKQILTNLLSNAFKYTEEGVIEFGVKSVVNGEIVQLTFYVKDTGLGIPKEDLPSIFSEYTRIDAQINRKINGTGLGLSITKMLVELMNGEISVTSEYGKGSCFTVTIPQKFVSGETIGAAAAESLRNLNYASGKRRNKTKIARIIMPYAHILVVDDVAANHDVAKGMMKPYKMKIDCVLSGQAAIDAIRRENVKYSAVFMDQMMPEIDGIEAARIIREEIGTEYAKNVPIIAFTANALAGNEEMFLSKGFNAFITKPIDIKRLDAILHKWVKDETKENIYEENPEGDNSAEKTESFDFKIDGIDLKKGLERFNGDKNVYLQVLKSFAVNTKILLDAMKNITKENLAEYAINVHGAKSSCRGICAEELGTQAETLEKAAKAGDFDFVAADNPALTENILKLIFDIEAALNKNTEKAEKIKRDKPYNEALKQLRAACRDYKIEDIDNIMKEIEVFEYTNDEGLVRWLRENADQMNYMEITARLSEEFNDA